MFEKFLAVLQSIADSLAKIAAGGGSLASGTTADKPKTATADKPKPGATTYTAKHSKAEAQAAANEVKEAKGVKVIKAIIAGLGYEKMADISKAEDLDKLYEQAKAALGEGEAEATDEDGI